MVKVTVALRFALLFCLDLKSSQKAMDTSWFALPHISYIVMAFYIVATNINVC